MSLYVGRKKLKYFHESKHYTKYESLIFEIFRPYCRLRIIFKNRMTTRFLTLGWGKVY